MRNKLCSWIDKFGGATKVGAALDLSEAAVGVWMRGHGSPEAKTIDRLIKLSKGELTFDIIYKCSTCNPKK